MPRMTMRTVPRFKLSRVLGRIGMVLVLQALALVLGALGAAIVLSVVDIKGLGALVPVVAFLIVVEVILVVRVCVLAWRAYRSERIDVAVGWLIGILVLVAIPFLLFMVRVIPW